MPLWFKVLEVHPQRTPSSTEEKHRACGKGPCGAGLALGSLGDLSVPSANSPVKGFEALKLPNYKITQFPDSLRSMDYIFTPWRYAYITTAAKTDGQSGQCILCELPKLPDPDAKIVYRGKHCFIILNSFPYTSGHVMVVPFAHLDELQKLPEAAANEMMALSQKMEGVLRNVYSPDGVNLGMNIGRAAGAGSCGARAYACAAALGGRYKLHDDSGRKPGAAGGAGRDFQES